MLGYIWVPIPSALRAGGKGKVPALTYRLYWDINMPKSVMPAEFEIKKQVGNIFIDKVRANKSSLMAQVKVTRAMSTDEISDSILTGPIHIAATQFVLGKARLAVGIPVLFILIVLFAFIYMRRKR